jgi:hypothetical protein
MKHSFRRLRTLLILVTGLAALLWSQILWGNRTFSYDSSVPLESSMPGGGMTQVYAASVGGVAFSGIAVPNITVDSVRLAYDGAQPDGSRLKLILNGSNLTAPVYDWEMVPIAHFADSKSDSCFTLFGSLVDKTRERQVLATGGRILNYHPAFFNTLLGLRMFQLDLLIEAEALPGLPRGRDGQYLLGAGEKVPNVAATERAAVAVSDSVTHIEASLRMKFRSYVVSDYHQKVAFGPKGDELAVTGDPYYYCWRYTSDKPDYDAQAVEQSTVATLEIQMAAARSSAGPAFQDRDWLVSRVREGLTRYEAGYRFYDAGTVVDLLKLPDSDRPAMLRRYSTDSLKRLLVDLQSGMESYQVEFMENYSDQLSGRTELLSAMNPAVWDAGTAVMRYSALFRYYKQKDPGGWVRFLKSIENVPVNPKAQTPTVMM